MPFFKYEINHHEGDSGRIYDAIFWARSKEEAEEHIFHSVDMRAEQVAFDIHLETDYLPELLETEDRCVEFSAENGTVYSWLVSQPEIHEVKPEYTPDRYRWGIGDWGWRPPRPVAVLPSNLDTTQLAATQDRRLERLSETTAARVVVRFLYERNDDWKPFTYDELRSWALVNEAEDSLLQGLAWLQNEDYLVKEDAPASPIFQITDGFIRDMFTLYGEIIRG